MIDISRKDFLQKTTNSLTKDSDMIAVPDMKMSDLLKSRHLARSLTDASWSECRRMLEYKGRLVWEGRHPCGEDLPFNLALLRLPE